MDLNSPLLRELMGRTREIVRGVIAPNAAREDAEATWPEPAMRALAQAGLTALHVPAEMGGHGQGMAALVAVTETLASESPSTALCFAMHCVGTAVIAAKPTDDQQRRYLEPISRGEHITTLALSEPGTGAHFWLPRTELRADSDGYVLHGTKSFVTNGGHADSYVVSTAASAEAAGDGTFSCVVVDAGVPDLRWDDPWVGFGMRSNSSRTLHLDHVRIPRGNLLGSEGDQLWYVFEVVAPYFLMAMAGTYLGVARAAFDIAREHVATRRHAHSGEILAANDVVAHRLGGMWIELEAASRLVHDAAVRGDSGDGDALNFILACKAAAGEASVSLANEAMTLAGGIAYRDNSKLSRLLRDARASHVMSPTTDLLKQWIGRSLTKLPLL